MDGTRLRTLLRLLLAPGMNSAAAARLLRVHGDEPGRVLGAPREALASVRGVGPALASAVAAAPGTPEEAAREEARCGELGVGLVGPGDRGYPLPLIHAYDPPPLLWVRGAWTEGDAASISVVGSRRATPYGVVQAGKLARGAAERGLAVASGLARGVDTAAHRGALEAPRGRTLAVLGSGHARPYPWENRHLLLEVAARGAVLSEFPLDTPPLAHNFPRRNRVLAALSLGTLVVEASERSGSLITAYLALEAGREVMAVPGRVDAPNSRGVHRLLREGAALVEGPGDVMEALELEDRPLPAAAAAEGAAAGTAARLLALLDGSDPRDADELAAASGIPAPEVRAALVDLEIDGRVRPFPGGRYARAR